MAKPILYFALYRSFSLTRGFGVIGVTSEQRRQVYGRTVPGDLMTHMSAHDVFHRFPVGTTVADAVAAVDRAAKAWDRMAPEVEQARLRVAQLSAHQKRSAEEAAKTIPAPSKLPAGIPPAPTPAHKISDERTWSCGPGGTFSWATRAEMERLGRVETVDGEPDVSGLLG